MPSGGTCGPGCGSGARVSLFIGLVAALVQTFIGVVLGGVAGYFGGTVDMVLMRAVDILDTIPFLIYVILIMMVLGSGLVPIIIAFAITGWLSMARLVRGQVLQLKEQEFMIAAKALGASYFSLIFKHLVPNMMGIIIVTLTMKIPGAIFTEAFLSYIGIGVEPPMTSWGQLANMGGQVDAGLPSAASDPGLLYQHHHALPAVVWRRLAGCAGPQA